jgi:dimethylamine--corrinoid protein Co-methyltransferase
MEKYVTRMGDGFKVEMTEAEIRRDIEDAIQDAVKRAKIPPLTDDEIGYLVELFKSPDNAVGVKRGNEVILSYDSGTTKFKRANVSVSKIQSLQIYERMLGSDTLELAHIDYSFKPVKPIVVFEQPILEQALLQTWGSTVSPMAPVPIPLTFCRRERSLRRGLPMGKPLSMR